MSPSGLREVFVAEFQERAERFPGNTDYDFARRHWLTEQRPWESTEPVEVSCWELPREFRPPGADDYDRYRVEADGGLTLVSRAAEDHAALLARLAQREAD
jgi:hypothetical protein